MIHCEFRSWDTVLKIPVERCRDGVRPITSYYMFTTFCFCVTGLMTFIWCNVEHSSALISYIFFIYIYIYVCMLKNNQCLDIDLGAALWDLRPVSDVLNVLKELPLHPWCNQWGFTSGVPPPPDTVDGRKNNLPADTLSKIITVLWYIFC